MSHVDQYIVLHIYLYSGGYEVFLKTLLSFDFLSHIVYSQYSKLVFYSFYVDMRSGFRVVEDAEPAPAVGALITEQGGIRYKDKGRSQARGSNPSSG